MQAIQWSFSENNVPNIQSQEIVDLGVLSISQYLCLIICLQISHARELQTWEFIYNVLTSQESKQSILGNYRPRSIQYVLKSYASKYPILGKYRPIYSQYVILCLTILPQVTGDEGILSMSQPPMLPNILSQESIDMGGNLNLFYFIYYVQNLITYPSVITKKIILNERIAILNVAFQPCRLI